MKYFLLILCFTFADCKLSCLGERGDPVDMYILYKLPRLRHETDPNVQTGHGYVYLDSSNPTFKLSSDSIADQQSAAGRTLDQVYNKYSVTKEYQKNKNRFLDGPTDQSHIFYNDETPPHPSDAKNVNRSNECGHTKGAVAFDKDSGFWLITSVPKYPPRASDGYNYPHTGCMYGQMFMCVSFNATKFNDIGLQLRFNDPHIYDSNLPQSWEETYPNIKKLLDREMIRDAPFTNIATLTSLAGSKYLHFAKTGDFDEDLYHDFVAPSLHIDLLTETWQHDHKTNIGPSCNGDYTVLDITELSVLDIPFSNKDDHAKFVVSASDSHAFICVGDINRETTQFVRGGGTMCIDDGNLWYIFHNMVNGTNHCTRGEL